MKTVQPQTELAMLLMLKFRCLARILAMHCCIGHLYSGQLFKL
jgi:hypothetical protein